MGYLGNQITTVFPTSISVDTATIATANISNQLTDANMASGSVLQVQQGLYTSYTSFTNTSMAASDLTVNITPTSTSSKILLVSSCQMGYPTQNNGVTMTFLRGSTNLASTDRPGFAHIGDSTGGNQRTYQMLTITMNFLDSPSTTSQITYSVGFQLDGGTGYFNRNLNGDTGSRGTSVITAMEIAG